MLSRRNQWILAGVLVAGIVAWQAFDNQDRPSAATETAPLEANDTARSGATQANVRLVRADIMDQQGFATPMVAGQIGIPEGWESSGGVLWNPQAACHGQIKAISWAAISPDQRSAFTIQPGVAWQEPKTQIPTDPCPALAIYSIRDFLSTAARIARPNATILDFRELPELARQREHESREAMQRRGQSLNPSSSVEWQAGQLLVGFMADGIDMREIVHAVLTINRLGGRATYSVGEVVTLHAPAEKIDFSLLERILASNEINQEWSDRASQQGLQILQAYFDQQRMQIMTDHQRKMAAINARGMADRQAIRMQTANEIAGIRAAGQAASSATDDAIHRRNLEAIGEYNTYRGVDGRDVQQTIHDSGRVMQNTTFPDRVYTTDDPWAVPAADHEELQRIR